MSDTSLVYVLFAYGLALFAMSLAITLEIRRDSVLPLAKALPWLAGFGMVHSGVEWVEMFHIMHRGSLDLRAEDFSGFLILLLLVVSGLFLTQFAVSLMASSISWAKWVRWLPIGLLLVWLALWLSPISSLPGDNSIRVGIITARYIFYLPGSILAGLALLSQRPAFKAAGLPQVAHACTWGAAAFVFKGLIGGLVVPPASFFPASVSNYGSFIALTGFRVEVFRAIAAIGITYFVVRVLRLFETQRQQELAHVTHQIKRLSVQALSAQEEERKRIARELHDDTAQLLSSLLLKLKLLERAKTVPETKSRMDDIINVTEQATEGVRRMAFELRPAALEDLGLPEAIHWFAKELAAQRGLLVEMNSSGFPGRLPDEMELALYRVAQEALINVAKHSGAHRARVTLSQTNGNVRLCIEDSGRGFDVKAVTGSRDHGLGLFGMSERVSLLGGTFQINSQPGSGTTITLEVPVGGEVVAR